MGETRKMGGGIVRHEVLRLSSGCCIEQRIDMRGSTAMRSELRLWGVGAGASGRGNVGRNFGGEDCGG